MYPAYMRVEVIGKMRNMVKARVQLDENNDICLLADESQIIELDDGMIPVSWIRNYASQYPADCFPFMKMIERWEDV